MLKEFLQLIFVAPWIVLDMFFEPSRFQTNWVTLAIAYVCILVCYVPGAVLMLIYVIGLCIWRGGNALLARVLAKKKEPTP